MAEQQFCLRWNHHHTTLINVFESLLKDESLVDVTLYAEGRPVRAHKVVLSACSPYFKAIFSAHQESHPVIILKDVLFSELRALVDYMYIGEVNVSQDQLGSLIKTAESLKIKGLADGGTRKPPPQPASPPPPPLPPISLPMVMPSQRLPLPPMSLPLPPPPFPTLEHHVARRSVSPHAVISRSGDGAGSLLRPSSAVSEQLNGRVSPPPAKKQRRPSGAAAAPAGEDDAASAGSAGSPLPATAPDQPRTCTAADQPERPPSAHSSPSLPRIPATITPLPTASASASTAPGGSARSESPLELDLSVRTSSAPPVSVKTELTGAGSGLPLMVEPPVRSLDPRADDDVGSEDGSETEPLGDDVERAGPSALPTGPPGSEPILPAGYMNWQLGGGGDGVDPPFVPPNEAGGPQDAFLHRAFNVRFQQLLQQQRYDQLLGHGAPPPPPPPGGLGLPLLLRRESPTSPCKQYACDKCGRQYASSGNLKRHVKYECGVEPQFQCPVCKKKFQHRHSVKIHVVSTHKTENPELIKDYLM